jgi:hypothetical protein
VDKLDLSRYFAVNNEMSVEFVHMPNPARIFRRLRRKILPRKVRQWLSDFLWRATGVILEIGGLIVAVWGLVLIFKTHPFKNANGLMVTDWSQSISFVVIGLGAYALGFSLRKMYHYNKGQIESRYVKEEEDSKG